ncbi:unnamed protein product [Brachionus calyciflorus]|uniref:Uncharacterized protein n=1 Tax=Brachionus calyciflorus TaxID=104777 RepID=A0A813W9N8_9BILA|nr:unnamed protein product [Brachionus calyciflorus]
MMAIKFQVTDILHPFHKLNGISGSIDISKILDDLPREEGAKYFKESKNDIKQIANEQSLAAIATQLNALNNNITKSNEDNQSLRSMLIEHLSPSSSRYSSPSTTRKVRNNVMEISDDEDRFENIFTQRDFTNTLRSRINHDFKDDPNKTLGYYNKKYPGKMSKIKC